MDREFEEEEVIEGIRMCAIDKAPGSDGFSMFFFFRILRMS